MRENSCTNQPVKCLTKIVRIRTDKAVPAIVQENAEHLHLAKCSVFAPIPGEYRSETTRLGDSATRDCNQHRRLSLNQLQIQMTIPRLWPAGTGGTHYLAIQQKIELGLACSLYDSIRSKELHRGSFVSSTASWQPSEGFCLRGSGARSQLSRRL